MTLHAITVLGHDRPGIIAEATGRLTEEMLDAVLSRAAALREPGDGVEILPG